MVIGGVGVVDAGHEVSVAAIDPPAVVEEPAADLCFVEQSGHGVVHRRSLPSVPTSSLGFDYQRVFHIGIRVPALEPAMAELSAGMGVTWASVQEREQRVWLPGQGMAALPLRFVYSAEGPQHLELLEGPAGTIWGSDGGTGVHHLGVWVDDIKAETERIIAAGWTLELAGAAPEDGYGAFTYVRSPAGVLVEPVWSVLEPMFQRWWAGGPLG